MSQSAELMFDYETVYRSFRLEIPERGNLAGIVLDHQLHLHDKLALVFADENGALTQLTYQQLIEHSNRLGNVFRARGVQPGDRIALLLPASVEIYLCYLAAMKIGAVAVAISVLFGIEGVEYRIRDSGARLAVTVPEARSSLANVKDEVDILMVGKAEGTELGFTDALERAAPKLQRHLTAPLDPVLLVYTSGTTGGPKGVVHTRRSLTHTIETQKLWTGLHPEDLHWNVADPTWLGGMMTDLLCAWPVGATVFKYRRNGPFDPEEAFRLLEERAITNLWAPPTAYRMMGKLEAVRQKYHISALRLCTSAGEALNAEVIAWGRRELGLTILDGYGQSEGIMMATNFPGMVVKPGSMGRPAPGVRLQIATPAGEQCRPGEAGEIVVHRDARLLFLQYWNRPTETAERYLGEWYRTGDSAWQDEEGYLHFDGRTDDVIISAGYRIGPFEVESCISEHPAVAESAVVAKPDPEGIRGNIVKAYVVLGPGFSPSEGLKREIQELVRTRLSQSEYPREVEFISEFPKTRTGKVLRKELRQRAYEEKTGKERSGTVDM